MICSVKPDDGATHCNQMAAKRASHRTRTNKSYFHNQFLCSDRCRPQTRSWEGAKWKMGTQLISVADSAVKSVGVATGVTASAVWLNELKVPVTFISPLN
jgi:hypothetical protein